ncbi:MAG: hypothetical protein WC623_07880 [Pedobacter sp.]|uniref:hypothetical protein n=1 Tax=Pedobacter sp. TaxID=1411316 RepID=UPI0035683FA2
MLSEKLLNNTKWRITHEYKSKLDPDIFTFNSNGSISIENKKYMIGTWAVSGDALIIKYNNYVECRGKLVNREIIGEAKNIKGTIWEINLKSLSPLTFDEVPKTSALNLGGSKWHLELSTVLLPDKIVDERHIVFNNGGTATLMKKNGGQIAGIVKWVLEGDKVIININTFAKYVGKIKEDSFEGELTNIKGKKLLFKGVRKKEVFQTNNVNVKRSVFTAEKYFDSSKFHFLDYYQKYWLDGERNPAFDNHSSNILNLKKGESGAIIYFYNRLNPLISTDELVICYVPSSDPENQMSGVRKLCSMIAKIKNRIDGTHCIVRHKKIDKLASGGNRSIQIQLDSLKIENLELIKGMNILLLDDVTTTNNSLKACKQLLVSAGANDVYCFALGQTS